MSLRFSGSHFREAREYRGQTVQVLSRRGRKLNRQFTLITNECENPNWVVNALGERKIVVDSWRFPLYDKEVSPVMIYRRDYKKNAESEGPLRRMTALAARATGFRINGEGFPVARNPDALVVVSRRRIDAYTRRGLVVLDGDPWASAVDNFFEFGGYAAFEDRERIIEIVYWGTMSANVEASDTVERKAAEFLECTANNLAATVVAHSGPVYTGHSIAGVGYTYPFSHDFAINSDRHEELRLMFPSESQNIDSLFAD